MEIILLLMDKSENDLATFFTQNVHLKSPGPKQSGFEDIGSLYDYG